MNPTWEQGDVQLYLGDCLEILPTLEAGSVDAVVTDPPYGIAFDRATWGDEPEQYGAFMLQWLKATHQVAEEKPHFVWQAMPNVGEWHKWFPEGFRVFAACKGFVQFRPTPIQWSWDAIIFWGDLVGQPSVYRKDWFVQNLAPFGAHRPKIEHPCPKPYELTEYIVEIASLPQHTILDPFMGSGTTGVACVKTGRKFIGIEIDPGYFDIAVKRISEAQMQPRLDGI